MAKHIACIKDGKLDTWDSSEKTIYTAWKIIKGNKKEPFSFLIIRPNVCACGLFDIGTKPNKKREKGQYMKRVYTSESVFDGHPDKV